MLMASGASGDAVPCPSQEELDSSHLLDVCDSSIDSEPAYSVTFEASMSPPPAAQQITLFQREEGWILQIAGYDWQPGTGLVTTRRNVMEIPAADAQTLIDRIENASNRLAQLSFYGDPLVICTDGATTEIAIGAHGKRRSFSQHSCAPESELHEIASEFRAVALKYDPGFDGMLGGLDQ